MSVFMPQEGSRDGVPTHHDPTLVHLNDRPDQSWVGVLTDPPGSALGRTVLSDEAVRHLHVGMVQKLFLLDEVAAAGGMSAAVAAESFDDLSVRETTPASVEVDGQTVRGQVMRVGGVEIFLSADLDQFPYAMARPAGSQTHPWPALRTRTTQHGRDVPAHWAPRLAEQAACQRPGGPAADPAGGVT